MTWYLTQKQIKLPGSDGNKEKMPLDPTLGKTKELLHSYELKINSLEFYRFHITGYFPKMQIFINFPNGLTSLVNLFWDAV